MAEREPMTEGGPERLGGAEQRGGPERLGGPEQQPRIRELERRAFARPRDDADRLDAAAAAAELAELRRRSAPPPATARPDRETRSAAAAAPWPGGPFHDGALVDDALDDPPSLGERIAAAATALVARLRSLPPRTLRIAGAIALAAGALAAAGFAVHAVATAPPPAFAVFADDAELVPGDGLAFASSLEERGTFVLEGPFLFGDREDDMRIAVYREWLDAGRSEVCAALVAQNTWGFAAACTSEESFRRSGLVAEFEQEGLRVDYGWMPDGDVILRTQQTGALTMDDVRALGLPAVEAIDAAGADPARARALLPWYSTVLAGPLELGIQDRWQFFAVIVEGDAAPWESAPRPLICLVARDDRTRPDGAGTLANCATAERFADEGISLQTDDGLTAQWDAADVFDAELP